MLSLRATLQILFFFLSISLSSDLLANPPMDFENSDITTVIWTVIKPGKEFYASFSDEPQGERQSSYRLRADPKRLGQFHVEMSTQNDHITTLRTHAFRLCRGVVCYKNKYVPDKFFKIRDTLSQKIGSNITLEMLVQWIEFPDSREIISTKNYNLRSQSFISSFFIGLLISELYPAFHSDMNHALYSTAAITAWWLSKTYLYYRWRLTRKLNLPDSVAPYLIGASMGLPAACDLILRQINIWHL